MYFKLNSQGEDVKSIQESLKQLGFQPGAIDGIYGEKTERAIIQFQEEYGLYADGIVGPTTWKALHLALEIRLEEQTQPLLNADKPDLLKWVRVPADPYRDGYDRFFLREDAAAAYLKVREVVMESGGVLTSSGARRSLNAHVSSSRSATSFHYTGRALDLMVGSGMQNRTRDPYVIMADGERYWRVFARADGGEQMEINAVTYNSRNSGKIITGKFLDITSIFQQNGFKRIRARRSFFNGGIWLGAEWWHFQYESGLESGATTFGHELLRVYTETQLRDSPPWEYRDYVFGVNWF